MALPLEEITETADHFPGDELVAALQQAPQTDIGIEPRGNSRAGCSFSQPRLTTMAWPPKFGFMLMLRSVRIGISAPGASIATPQP